MILLMEWDDNRYVREAYSDGRGDTVKAELVSIVMPVFNGERYLARAIMSVQAQFYSLWELIIVDDCSQDGTRVIIESFIKQDKRISAIYNEQNMGAAKSRQYAIESAGGDWIAFLDCDDQWDAAKLQKQLEAARRDSAGFIFTGSKFINQEDDEYGFILNVPAKVTYQKLLSQNVISCSSVMISKAVLKDYQMVDGPFHEDYLLWLKILRDGTVAIGINEPLLIYRISSESKSGNKAKAAVMTYRVYRQMGFNIVKSSYYWLIYVIKSLNKYLRIYSKH